MVLAIRGDYSGLLNSAATLISLGRYEEARDRYLKLLSYYKNDADGKLGLGNVRLLKLNLHDQSIASHTDALTIRPHDPVILLNRAIVRSTIGQNQLALSDYNESIKEDPNDPSPYWHRASLYETLSNYELFTQISKRQWNWKATKTRRSYDSIH